MTFAPSLWTIVQEILWEYYNETSKDLRIDKLFGLATLICLLAIALMVYNDFFRTTTGTGKKQRHSQEQADILMIIRI